MKFILRSKRGGINIKEVEITVKGGKRNYLEINSALLEISNRLGCTYSFVSCNPDLYVNPEISVPALHAEKFEKQLEAAGMLFSAKEAYQEAIEEIKNRRN